MARIIYGNIVNEIVGKIGGLTFQRNSSGTIVRRNPAGKRRGNSLQAPAKSNFYTLGGWYRQLSGANKSLWAAFALSFAYVDKWGNSKVLNGFQLYRECAYYYYLMKSTLISSPPALVLSLPFDAFTVTLGANSILLNWAMPQATVDQVIFIYATPPLSSPAGINRKSLRIIDYLISDNFNSIDIGPQWESYFGLNVTNDLINVNSYVVVTVIRMDKNCCIPSLVTSSSN